MSNSAITTQVAQLKVGNVQNQADTSAVYSAGAWDFKNASAVTSVKIDNSGNVGIGTGSPSQKLHVNGGIIRIDNTNILFLNPNYDNGNSIAIQGYSNVPLVFATNNTERMRIDSSGNVGIGTASPVVALEIVRNSAGTGASDYPNIRINNQNATGYSGLYFNQGATLKAGLEVKNDVGALVFGNGAGFTERMRIDASGKVKVGTTAASVKGKLTVQTTDQSSYMEGISLWYSDSAYWNITNGTGNHLYFGFNLVDKGRIDSTSGNYIAMSDVRLKKNISSIKYGLNEVLALNPVCYNMKEQDDEAPKQLGFIAQEIKQVLSEVVPHEPDPERFLGLNSAAIIPVLVKAIQELSVKNDALEARLAALEAK